MEFLRIMGRLAFYWACFLFCCFFWWGVYRLVLGVIAAWP